MFFFFLVIFLFKKYDFLRDIFGIIGYMAKLGNLVGVHCKFFFHFESKIAIWVKLLRG
jgi:hypothetical protein